MGGGEGGGGYCEIPIVPYRHPAGAWSLPPRLWIAVCRFRGERDSRSVGRSALWLPFAVDSFRFGFVELLCAAVGLVLSLKGGFFVLFYGVVRTIRLAYSTLLFVSFPLLSLSPCILKFLCLLWTVERV